jgi:hypothetical protein
MPILPPDPQPEYAADSEAMLEAVKELLPIALINPRGHRHKMASKFS